MPNVKVVKALIVLLIISTLCSPLLSFPVNAATGIILIEKTSAPSPPGQNIPYGGNVNLYFGTVTFSGAQFYIYLSRDGLGTISPGDLNFGLTINVADVGALSVTAISNSRIGFGWANASLPSNIAGGNYFAKALDGGSVAVTDTYFIVTSQFNAIPTSGPGGAYVWLNGNAFEPNSYVNLSYYRTAPPFDKIPIANLVSTNSLGQFTYASPAPDLMQVLPAGDQTPSWTAITFNAKSSTIERNTIYNEYRRGLKQVHTAIATGLWGNGTDLVTASRQVGQTIRLTGSYFSPLGAVVILWDGVTSIGTVAVNNTGGFDTTVTVPATSVGGHWISIQDPSVAFYVKVYVANVGDSYEPDEGFSQYSSMTVTTSLQSQSRSITPAGDNDYVRFYANPGTYTFYTDSSIDTVGYLYDSNQVQLAYNDDTIGTQFRISYTISNSGYYFLRVRAYSSSATGSYTLYFQYQPSWIDFGIIVSPQSQTVVQGDSTTCQITISLTGGSTQAVSLSCVPSITGVTYSFNPSSGNPTYSSILTIQTSSNTPLGLYVLNITATSASLWRRVLLQLVVVANPQYTLTVSSAHGNPTPSGGVHTFTSGSSITCSVPSSVTEGGITYACTGWTGTGSIPASGYGWWTTFTITQNSSITWNWRTISTSENLFILPAIAIEHDRNLIDRARLTSVTSGQTVTVSPAQSFSVNYAYQLWQGSNPSEIDQLLFIPSWTPTWPPSSTYYRGIYSSTPPSYPGTSGTGTATFTAPSTPGTYYIWFCFNANYGFEQAANTFTTSLNGLAGHIKVIVQSQLVQYNLTVASAHRSPSPSVGVHSYSSGSSVSCTTAGYSTENGSWRCVGWTGTGSVPPSGSGTNVTFTITQNSTITWLWQAVPFPLTNGYVTPSTGNALTNFTYYASWSFPGAPAPAASVSIDGTYHNMTLNSGTLSSGVYRYSTSLDPGDHNYTYVFSIPTMTYVLGLPPLPGPTVLFVDAWFSLNVSSAHGNPNPSVGTHIYPWTNPPVTCSVTSPVTEGGVTYTCTGWTGTGSVPASGSGTTTTFNITQDSSITWLWLSSNTSIRPGDWITYKIDSSVSDSFLSYFSSPSSANNLPASCTVVVLDVAGSNVTFQEKVTFANGTTRTQIFSLDTKALPQIEANFKAMVSSLQLIQSQAGVIQSYVGSVNSYLSNIGGNMIAIQSNLNAINASLIAMRNNIATMLSSLGAVTSALSSSIQSGSVFQIGRVVSIQRDLNAMTNSLSTTVNNLNTISTNLTSIYTALVNYSGNTTTLQQTIKGTNATLTVVRGNAATLSVSLSNIDKTLLRSVITNQMVPYFVSSGLNPGDPIYAGSTSASITQNLTRNYGGVTKTINLMTQETNWYDSTNRCYFNLSESDYWNRETGVLFEWAFTMVIWNATFSASLSKHYVMANCSLSGWTYNSTSANSNPTILGVEIQPELITKPQTLMIRVNATDTEDRQNITVTCAITLPNGTTSTLTATLANSTFTLQYPISLGHPEGNYQLTIRALDMKGGTAEYRTTFKVQPPPPVLASVTGWIQTSTGQGIANASVTLSMKAAYQTYATHTNSQGFYSFTGVVAGEYSLVSSSPQYSSKQAVVTAVGNSNTVQNLILLHLPIITGRVTSQNGTPVFNASVTATDSSGSESSTTTNTTGQYALITPSAGLLIVKASAEGYASTTSGMQCVLEQTATLDFVLTRSGILNLRITNSLNSAAIDNASASLVGTDFRQTATTNATGDILFKNVPAGTYILMSQATGYITNITTLIIFSAQTTTLLIALKPAGNITGTVTDSQTHSPISNAMVSLLNRDRITLASTLTNQNGTYSFERVQAASYIIEVNAYGYNSTSTTADVPPFGTLTTNFQINPSLIVLDIQVPSQQFSRGETINITITPTNVQGQPITNVADITATLKGPANESLILTCVRTANSYSANYTIRSNETMGLWLVTITVRDTTGISAKTAFPIYIREAFLLSLQTDKAVYTPLDKVNFAALAARYSNTSLLLNQNQVSASIEIKNPRNISVGTYDLIGGSNSFSKSFALIGLEIGEYTATLRVWDQKGNSAQTNQYFTIAPAFAVTVRTDRLVYNLTDTIHIEGTVKFANGTSAAQVTLHILLQTRGLWRTYAAVTNSQGNFTLNVNSIGIAGNYTLRCSSTINGITETNSSSFTVLGLTINPPTCVIDLPAGASNELGISVGNTGETNITGVTWSITPINGTGVTVYQTSILQSTLTTSEWAELPLRITASPSASGSSFLKLTLSSSTGAFAYSTLEIRTHPATPVMDWNPKIVDISQQSGKFVTYTVTVRNVGYASLNNVTAGSTSIPWITINNPQLGDIAPQQSKKLDITIAPPNSTEAGLYQTEISISSSNQNSQPVYIVVRVTTASNGSLSFHLTDDTNQKVAKATVSLQFQEFYTQTQTLVTDSEGYAAAPDLPGGRYAYTITAEGYETAYGTTIVQPDSTVDVKESLITKAMEFSFDVEPIIINDEYVIRLNMTFETEAPTPLLIPTPPTLTFRPDRSIVINNGFAQDTSFNLHNIGLIPVSNVSIIVGDATSSNYSVTLGQFGKSLYLTQIDGGSSLQIPCKLTILPGTNISLLKNSIACKIDIAGYFVYFDVNNNPKTAKVVAEVPIIVFEGGHRILDINPPVIYSLDINTNILHNWITDDTIYLPFLTIAKLPNVTITNAATAEKVSLFTIAAGMGIMVGVDVIDVALGNPVPGLEGIFFVHCNMTGPSFQPLSLNSELLWYVLNVSPQLTADPAVALLNGLFLLRNTPGWIPLTPGENARLQSTIAEFDIPLEYDEIAESIVLSIKDVFTGFMIPHVSIPGISANIGLIRFCYRWEYDSTPSIGIIPIITVEITWPSITIPISGGYGGGDYGGYGPSGGGAGGGGWWIQWNPPHIEPPDRPIIPKVEPPQAPSVHEVVKLSISQRATLERDAFQANLKMTNTMSSANIENITVTLKISHMNGSDASQNFYFNVSSLQGISNIIGNGTITPGFTALVTWLIIPEPGAGGTTQNGIYYTIQAQIAYLVNQAQFNVSSSNETIWVKPQPFLEIEYYLPQDVTANVPFKLGIRVTNTGYGTARNFLIESAQPVIYENLSLLPISFTLVSSFVQGQSVPNSLKLNFGDVAPGETKIGYWLMVCTSSGSLSNFTASYTHRSELGGEETSLISVSTKILVRSIVIGDLVSGFLIGQNSVLEKIVDSFTGKAQNLVPVDFQIVYQDGSSMIIETGKYSGQWILAFIRDPFINQKAILRIQRSDGKVLSPLNYWMQNGKIIVIDDPEENYTIFFQDTVPPVLKTIDNYNGLWHTSDFTINMTNVGTASVNATYYRINGGSTQTVSASGQPRINIENSDNTLEYWSVSNTGIEESHTFVTGIKLDKTKPTGSILINNGSSYTSSNSVTLLLTASDALSGVYRVRLSNDGVWDTEPWETASSVKTLSLPAGDGNKTVHYQIKDNAGLLSTTYSDTITLDQSRPSIGAPSLTQSGDVQPNNPVMLSVTVNDTTSAIRNVTLQYTTDNGTTWTSNPMTYNASTSKYIAEIPGHPGGTLVKYRIIAHDNAENQATANNAGQYYVYNVIPEFPSVSTLLWTLTLAIISFAVINRKHKNPLTKKTRTNC